MTTMNWKAIGLGAIAVMLTALLLQQDPDSPDGNETSLMPGLKARLDDITEITVTYDAATVTVSREPDAPFTVREKSGYPADFETLDGVLEQLSEASWAELKTARPENHARLGLSLQDDDPPVHVTIAAGEDTHELLIGGDAETRGSFVRYPDADQVYLTRQTLDVPTDPMAWLDPVLVNVDSGRVQRVEIRTGTGLLVASRTEDGGMQVQDLPPGAELSYPTVADSLSRLLVNVRFEDVQPFNPQVFAGASRTTITADEESYLVETVEIEGDYWLHLDTPGARDWQYRISAYTFGEFNKTMDDLVKSDEQQ